MVCFGRISGSLGLTICILARLRLFYEPWLDQTRLICRLRVTKIKGTIRCNDRGKCVSELFFLAETQHCDNKWENLNVEKCSFGKKMRRWDYWNKTKYKRIAVPSFFNLSPKAKVACTITSPYALCSLPLQRRVYGYLRLCLHTELPACSWKESGLGRFHGYHYLRHQHAH